MIVPVHKVEAYLHQCLDSIREDVPAGDEAAVEIVAVDDASPDRCGELLDAYAARHGRMRVVHLTENVGLGLARNAGLDVAAGEYVWFVDSDDWLPAGTIPAVLERLRADRPDVLMLDHLRVYENGRQEIDASSPLLRGVTGVIRLADRPELLRVQHTAWNKVVRRTLLDELELRFHPGWYEDVPFSNPLLIGAEKIAVLDRVCYLYRQGRQGAITATRSERHFDAFDQYDRQLDWVRRHHPDPTVEGELFQLMINHMLVVVGNDGRIHPGMRRAFFHRLAEQYRRHVPATGYPRPGGVAGLKHRLVGEDNYLAYAALRQAHRLAGRLRRPAAPVTAPAPTTGPSAGPSVPAQGGPGVDDAAQSEALTGHGNP
ncbi:glycosyltransferase [Micromonospora sp. CPCC 205711]|uniref:glycosyltransferase family 2 protein n=1 Tax=Micromonospora sp. CPCC 205547 TaxID=3122400 RepID=UPI002FEED635